MVLLKIRYKTNGFIYNFFRKQSLEDRKSYCAGNRIRDVQTAFTVVQWQIQYREQ